MPSVRRLRLKGTISFNFRPVETVILDVLEKMAVGVETVETVETVKTVKTVETVKWNLWFLKGIQFVRELPIEMLKEYGGSLPKNWVW